MKKIRAKLGTPRLVLGKPTAKMTATSSHTDLKSIIEMAIHELCIAQEKIAEILNTIDQEIHPRINQALAELDEALSS